MNSSPMRRAVKTKTQQRGTGKAPGPGVRGEDVSLPRTPVKKDPEEFQRPLKHVKLKRTKEEWAKVVNNARRNSNKAVYNPNE